MNLHLSELSDEGGDQMRRPPRANRDPDPPFSNELHAPVDTSEQNLKISDVSRALQRRITALASIYRSQGA